MTEEPPFLTGPALADFLRGSVAIQAEARVTGKSEEEVIASFIAIADRAAKHGRPARAIGRWTRNDDEWTDEMKNSATAIREMETPYQLPTVNGTDELQTLTDGIAPENRHPEFPGTDEPPNAILAGVVPADDCEVKMRERMDNPHFRDGWTTFRTGKPRSDNPHTYGHGSYNGWDDGWMEALYDWWLHRESGRAPVVGETK